MSLWPAAAEHALYRLVYSFLEMQLILTDLQLKTDATDIHALTERATEARKDVAVMMALHPSRLKAWHADLPRLTPHAHRALPDGWADATASTAVPLYLCWNYEYDARFDGVVVADQSYLVFLGHAHLSTIKHFLRSEFEMSATKPCALCDAPVHWTDSRVTLRGDRRACCIVCAACEPAGPGWHMTYGTTYGRFQPASRYARSFRLSGSGQSLAAELELERVCHEQANQRRTWRSRTDAGPAGTHGAVA